MLLILQCVVKTWQTLQGIQISKSKQQTLQGIQISKTKQMLYLFLKYTC